MAQAAPRSPLDRPSRTNARSAPTPGNPSLTSSRHAASVPYPVPPWPPPSHDPAEAHRALVEQVQNTIAIARALVASGRPVELAGLDQAVGLLCAKTLDLPPDQGRAARPYLSTILNELDLLHATLQENAPA